METVSVDAPIVYLTELTGMRVDGPNGQRIGRIREVAIAPGEHARRVSRFLLGSGRTAFMVRHDQVRSILTDHVQLRDDSFVPYYPDEGQLLLGKDLLDQQIVDVNGRKVVRVNDVALRVVSLNGHDELWIQEVGVGFQGAFRRLTEGVLPASLIRRLQKYLKPNSIPWDYCNIVEPDPQRRLKLKISHDRIGRIHPADLADIVEDLPPAEREALFETLDDHVVAEALSEVDPKIQVSIVEHLDKERAADIIEEMAPDSAADVLGELQEHTSQEILNDMEEAPAAEVEELLEYEEDTAGGLMNPQFIALQEHALVKDAAVAFQDHQNLLPTLTHLLLTDKKEHFIGIVPVARLTIADPRTPLRDLAVLDTITVDVDAAEQTVVDLFNKYNLFTLPVIDEDEELCGIITADDVISVLIPDR
ncbi:MAG: magnesium transporter MgtE [Solibacterales bacterium]|nr:magnesium transporter MgtE [Bryobacterales bacterium]|tara:strand:- start:6060 stop:7319 length:1260 start_codon:yes stop_codon:yes gene_type:complete